MADEVHGTTGLMTTGRPYLRVSKARRGQAARSTGEQQDENLADARSVGVTLGDPYCDELRSASRYARQGREGFDRLIADLRSGEFGADVLWLWESSRGSRRVGEWVELIDLCEKRGVIIRVTTHARFYDPRNSRDRRSLLDDAVDSEYESAKTSARARRDTAANAKKGRPHGPVLYGFKRKYDPDTGNLIAQKKHPDEAPMIKDLYKRVRRGQSFRSIARYFAAETEYRNRSGRPFSAAYLRQMVLNPAYAGLRVHAAGTSTDFRRAPAGSVTLYPAIWKGIVSEETYYALRDKVTDPSRRTSRPGRARHMVSMIARCGKCDDVLVAYFTADRPRTYRCRAGCVSATADDVEGVATSAMLEYLSRPDNVQELHDNSGDGDAERVAVRGDIERLNNRLSELADSVAEGEITAKTAGVSEAKILAKLDKLEHRNRELSTPVVLRGIVSAGEDIVTNWDTVPNSARRELARALLNPSMVGTLVLHPLPPGRGSRKTPFEDRIEFRRDDEPASDD